MEHLAGSHMLTFISHTRFATFLFAYALDFQFADPALHCIGPTLIQTQQIMKSRHTIDQWLYDLAWAGRYIFDVLFPDAC